MGKRVLIVAAVFVFAACSGGGSGQGDNGSSGSVATPVESGPQPAQHNVAERYFSKPFAGDFVNTNPFDHNYPTYPIVDDNSEFLDYRGEKLDLGWDGHNGNDWPMPVGTELLAVADGVVGFVGGEPCGWASATGDSLLLRINHEVAPGLEYHTVYSHVSEFLVELGQEVKRGDVIALSGNTGCSTGPHLHFMVRRLNNTNNGQPTLIDPFGWQGEGTDPWEYHADGAQSAWLWRVGEAPRPYGYEPD